MFGLTESATYIASYCKKIKPLIEAHYYRNLSIFTTVTKTLMIPEGSLWSLIKYLILLRLSPRQTTKFKSDYTKLYTLYFYFKTRKRFCINVILCSKDIFNTLYYLSFRRWSIFTSIRLFLFYFISCVSLWYL